MNHITMAVMKQNLILFYFFMALAMPAMAQRTPTMGWSSWNTFALD